MSKLPQGLKAEHIQIKGKAWLLKETTMWNYSWMTPFEQGGMLETYSTGTERTCSSQRLAKACSRPMHLIWMISHNYDCWLNKKELYCPWLLQININCGCPQDLQVQLRVVHPVPKWGQRILSKDAWSMLRDAAQGRKLLPRQDGSFKGLVNILWLFSFTTTRSGLQEIIPKLGQKIYTRNNADELLDKDSDSNP